MKARRIIVILLLVFFTITGNALKLEYLSIDAGILIIGNSDPIGAPSPIIPCIGASLPLVFEGTGFYLLPRLYLTGTDYLFTGTRPAPAEIERAQHYVFMAILDILAGYRISLSESIEMGFLAGISTLWRIAIAYDSASAAHTGDLTSYFYGNARFLYPDTEISVKWNFTRTLGFMFTLKALWPLFHLWDNENLPLYDQLIVSGVVGVCIGL